MATFEAFVMSLARLMTVSRCSSYVVMASLNASKSPSSTHEAVVVMLVVEIALRTRRVRTRRE